MYIPRPAWLAFCLLLLSAPSVSAQGRQFYLPYWQKKGGYYYRHYYFKPSAEAPNYRYHHLVYYPTHPGHYYFYNPYQGRYWGRYDVVAKGFSVLKEADRRDRIADIPAGAFPKPGPMPEVPESTDRTPIEPPPPGLPPDEAGELTREKVQAMLGTKEAPPRQAYSTWCRSGTYYFCCYFHEPTPGGKYKSHRLIYYPQQTHYLFYYNPYTSKYWGRYDIEAKGFALLEEKDRAERIRGIPESAFPKPGEMPPIPESKGKVKVLAPPRDLPE